MASDLTERASSSREPGSSGTSCVPSQPEVSVGYDRSNDVAVPFEGVSRRHARITFDGKEYWIEDVGSANGTYLNAVRLTQKERLKHLDIVTLGRRADLIFVRRSVEPSAQGQDAGSCRRGWRSSTGSTPGRSARFLAEA